MDAAVMQKYRVVVSVVTGKGKTGEPKEPKEPGEPGEAEDTAAPPEREEASAGSQTRYLARAPEVPGCQAEGATRSEALAGLEADLEARVAHMRQEGIEPPIPVDLQDLSGELAIKVSPDLHRDLLFWAKDRGVELDRAIPELLARAVRDGRSNRPMEAPHPRREGGRRQGRGLESHRYHDIMENRADFIEYVRQTERGGGGPGRGGSRGRGGDRGRG